MEKPKEAKPKRSSEEIFKEYVNKTLIPAEGSVELKELKYNYSFQEYNKEACHDIKGVLTSVVKDFDGDGEKELLVASLLNQELDEQGMKRNKIQLTMYEENEGRVERAAEHLIDNEVVDASEIEQDWIFFHEHQERTYICIQSSKTTALLADGSNLYVGAIYYQDGSFSTQFEQKVGGSSFYESKDEMSNIAIAMDALGLSKSGAKLRKDFWLAFAYDESGIENFIQIVGINPYVLEELEESAVYAGQYPQHQDASAMGSIYYGIYTGAEGTCISNFSDRKRIAHYSKVPEEALITKEAPAVDDNGWKEAYKTVINDTLAQYGEYQIYSVHDIDESGIPELIVLKGDSEATNMFYVYTYLDGAGVELGTFSGAHCALFTEEGESAITAVSAHMDGQLIMRITLSEEGVRTEKIREEMVTPGSEYYATPYPIPYLNVDDLSLLN